MLIKIMADDRLPDGDPRKKFTLIADLVQIAFVRGPRIQWRRADGSCGEDALSGNVYVLDEFGKTMDRFIVDPLMAPPPAA